MSVDECCIITIQGQLFFRKGHLSKFQWQMVTDSGARVQLDCWVPSFTYFLLLFLIVIWLRFQITWMMYVPYCCSVWEQIVISPMSFWILALQLCFDCWDFIIWTLKHYQSRQKIHFLRNCIKYLRHTFQFYSIPATFLAVFLLSTCRR